MGRLWGLHPATHTLMFVSLCFSTSLSSVLKKRVLVLERGLLLVNTGEKVVTYLLLQG